MYDKQEKTQPQNGCVNLFSNETYEVLRGEGRSCKMRELALKNDKLIEEEKNSNQLDIRFSRNKSKMFEKVGNYFTTIINSYNEVKQNIDPKEIYVVKFTQEQLNKFNSGDINFQKTADMESLLPNFVSKGTNNDIVSLARLEKIVLDNPEALQNVMTNVNRLVEAQKVDELELLLSEVKQISLDIKQGQKDDRRSKILGAESTIEQALLMSDENPQKEHLLLNAINQLNEGQASIIKEFEGVVAKNLSIPQNNFILLLKSALDNNFNESVSDSFAELNDQFSYIVKASDLLAKIYTVTGNNGLIDTVYAPIKTLIHDNHEYVSKLVELQDISIEEQRRLKWCIEPIDFIGKIGATELSDDDIITIEFSGQELLKGVENG